MSSRQLTQFRKGFRPFAPPEELERLLEFTNGPARGQWYSQGFEIGGARKDDLEGYSEAPEFLDGFLPVGKASGTGSQYFLWTVGQRDTAKMPVVVFGDEGGQHVVADNVRDFLVLLAFDAEPMVDHDSAVYFRRTSAEHSACHAAYVTWLKQTFDLASAKNVDPVVERAQARHGAAFEAWFARFVQDN
jgi:hypothetical protein